MIHNDLWEVYISFQVRGGVPDFSLAENSDVHQENISQP